MPDLSWAEAARLVHQRAQNCCEYCQTSQRVCGQSMHVEHIDPEGGNHLENLCLSCPSCNFSKGKVTAALDPLTQTITNLFNPRSQKWDDHFEWAQNGVIVIGRTPIGRATIVRLKMNIERVMTARNIWIVAGKHPPTL